MDESDLARVRPLFTESLALLAKRLGAAVIDGGTNSGVMQLMGRAREAGGYRFPLIGVATEGLVSWPGGPQAGDEMLEPHHTHFVLVPGSRWGDESPWLARLATALSASQPSVTVLINGGETAWDDVLHSVGENRRVIVVAGSGRTSDSLASAVRGERAGKRARNLAASGLLTAVDLANGPGGLSDAVERILSPKE